jgi:hypothetical protein
VVVCHAKSVLYTYKDLSSHLLPPETTKHVRYPRDCWMDLCAGCCVLRHDGISRRRDGLWDFRRGRRRRGISAKGRFDQGIRFYAANAPSCPFLACSDDESQLAYVGDMFNDVGFYFSKLSLLALYYEIISIAFSRLRVALHVITSYVFGACIITWCFDALWCIPISDNWYAQLPIQHDAPWNSSTHLAFVI